MPSLKCRLKKLRYKGIISDSDCDRLCRALDILNDMENRKQRIGSDDVRAMIEWLKKKKEERERNDKGTDCRISR